MPTIEEAMIVDHSMSERQEEMCTQDGSVDWKGHPSMKSTSGGWNVGILLLVNQGLATLAFYGVGVNLVLFMTKVLRQDNADAANKVSNWTGTAYIFSLVGAFLSDSYWGRYKTSVISQLIFVAGLVELSLTTHLLLLKPCVPGDAQPDCEPPTNIEILVFYLTMYQIALGNGAYQPSVATFGADQFDEHDQDEGRSKVAFFSYFYMANNLGTLFSNTILVYLEDKGEWVLGFWISAGAAFVALALFLAGATKYRHFKPCGNPLSRICQVIAASLKKWNTKMSAQGEDLYEVRGKDCTLEGGRKILHTPDFKFLDKAAAITYEDLPIQEKGHPANPWKLCTVTQVEELKCILRLFPIWFCTIIYSVAFTQMASVFIEQGATMKTSVSAFHIPPASMSVFEILSVSIFTLIYRQCLLPFLSRQKKGNPHCLTELQRMGIGLVISVMAMVSAGLLEFHRLKHAENITSDHKSTSSLSILWQSPQYVLMGASEVFMCVGQLEFFNNQAPDGLKSFGSALFVASMSIGNYLSSLLVTTVTDITSRGGQIGWISENLNDGHMDRFYFLLAALTAVDFIIFVAFAKKYRYISFEGKAEVREDSAETN